MRVRGVLYYSSAGFFLLQLEQACSYLSSICSPDEQRRGFCRLGRQQSRRIGHWIVEAKVGRSAPRPAEVRILIGRIRTMVVKSMTIGIELTLTTTPGNGHQLAPIGRLTVQSKFPSPLGLILWIPVISSPIRTELSFQDFRIARHAFRICLVPKPAKYNLTSRLKSPVTRARFQTR